MYINTKPLLLLATLVVYSSAWWVKKCNYICPDSLGEGTYDLAPHEPGNDNKLLRCLYERNPKVNANGRLNEGNMARILTCGYSMTDGKFALREANGVAVSETGFCLFELECDEEESED